MCLNSSVNQLLLARKHQHGARRHLKSLTKCLYFGSTGKIKQTPSTTRFFPTKPQVETLTYPGVVDKSGICRILSDSTFLEAGMNLESVPFALSIFQYKYRSNDSMLDYR